ncbi:hypothetical protein VTJ83DRAFT_4110 [Remersonia thermophila]|uniref:CBM1 domain-containing protein n=1 Tax=Remersonia thermophila TaxID=72144 RepID=A0ABR4DIA2_9PEZI
MARPSTWDSSLGYPKDLDLQPTRISLLTRPSGFVMFKPLFFACCLLGTATAQVWPPPPPWWPPQEPPAPTTTSSTRTSTTQVLPPGATQSLWGQCGGLNYEGPRRCPIGAYCKNDGNMWYEQCVPIETGTAPPATTRTTTVVTSGPVVITTYITYLTPTTTTPPPRTSIVTVTLRPDEPCDHPFLC